ncbi:MAG: TldD/PmbA family protein [Candidatus Cloacimonetes bacterium]|jgi:TldD protein|nr:TldD/PmbA family protein [Candidatus Cloacimonadota bacterium]MBT6994754.1 TldD/PmbA family protein [Candidatus Cloacimonadota bacterium]MBT7470278.1 TldD/PmbA family protein [Candidatus Cloacimonadota bacterium]
MNLKKYTNQFKNYTELRVQENRDTSIYVLNGDVMGNRKSATGGVSARVFKNGVWGFASNPNVTDIEVKKVIEAAEKNAIFLDSRIKKSALILPHNPIESINDFTTKKQPKSQKELLDFVREIDNYILAKYPKLKSRMVYLGGLDMQKNLLTSDGSASYSMIPRTMMYIALTVDDADSKPIESFEVYGGFGQFEDVFEKASSLFGKIDKQYEHLMKKAEGVYAKAGVHECVLDANLAGILAHEAIGHTTEADLVLGGSVAADYLNQQVASPLISLVDFAHTAFGKQCPVPVFVDDEGTKTEDAIIIENGVLKSYMHSKETALHFGVTPTGNARAYRFADEPLVRMRNTAILPGKSKIEEMIASIEDGYYLMKPSNGQADSTSEFMFGVVLGYEIKNGKLGKAIKDTTMSGVAFDLLKTVTMVSDDMAWDCSGMCGKKQPIPVGMGGPALKCKVNLGGK